jgi:hypothetical protein
LETLILRHSKYFFRSICFFGFCVVLIVTVFSFVWLLGGLSMFNRDIVGRVVFLLTVEFTVLAFVDTGESQ